jgi:ABC-type sugar transport system permease subunit
MEKEFDNGENMVPEEIAREFETETYDDDAFEAEIQDAQNTQETAQPVRAARPEYVPPKISDAKLAKEAARRQVYRQKRLAKYEREVSKMFEEINKAETREKSATQDPTKQREVELFAKKKRDELTKSAEQQRRVIMSSTASKLSYERRKALYGYCFIAIWMIGVLFVFAGPLLQSLIFSFSDTSLNGIEVPAYNADGTPQYNDDGERVTRSVILGIATQWNSFANYRFAFVGDPDYAVNLAATLGALLPDVSMILVFSLFVAVLLNQKFKGRTVMRAVFFFPVLIATGPVIAVINGTLASQGAGGSAAQMSTMFRTDMVDEFLAFLGIHNVGEQFLDFISGVTSDIFNLLWRSGIQILIFLSALQQIPTSAKEAASMEGATAWEFFWKITFPTISPMILANLIYTIIDSFSDTQNAVMRQILDYTGGAMGPAYLGNAAAFAWIYFGIIAIALVVVIAIVSKFIFYQVD